MNATPTPDSDRGLERRRASPPRARPPRDRAARPRFARCSSTTARVPEPASRSTRGSRAAAAGGIGSAGSPSSAGEATSTISSSAKSSKLELGVRRARADEPDLDAPGEQVGRHLRRVLHREAHSHARVVPRRKRARARGSTNSPGVFEAPSARRRPRRAGRRGGGGRGAAAARGAPLRDAYRRDEVVERERRDGLVERERARRAARPRGSRTGRSGSSRWVRHDQRAAPRTRAPRRARDLHRAGRDRPTRAARRRGRSPAPGRGRARSATRCCSPPESRSTRSWSRSAIPTSREHRGDPLRLARARRAPRAPAGATSARAAPRPRSASRSPAGRGGAAGARSRCARAARRSARGESAATSRPSTSTRPAVGASEVLRSRRSVDLPAPLGPTIATRSPGRIVERQREERVELSVTHGHRASGQRRRARLRMGAPLQRLTIGRLISATPRI